MSYADLRLLARMHSFTQKARLAKESMVRSAAVDVAFIEPVMEAERANEEQLVKALRATMRTTVPQEILDWQKSSPGVGEHLLARLLGVIGDPYVAFPRYWREGTTKEDRKRVLVEGDPFIRRVSDLWSYCGHGDPTRKLRKGMTQRDAMALGSPEAKMILHLIAESTMKQVRNGEAVGEYRRIYDESRDRYSRCVTCQADPANVKIAMLLHPAVMSSDDEPVMITPAISTEEALALMSGSNRPECPTCSGSGERLHVSECVRCGPSGKPAQIGSPWSLKHQHTAALRKVGKEILRDLWRAARAAHERQEAGVSDVALALSKAGGMRDALPAGGMQAEVTEVIEVLETS
jgi:hypothetical protein